MTCPNGSVTSTVEQLNEVYRKMKEKITEASQGEDGRREEIREELGKLSEELRGLLNHSAPVCLVNGDGNKRPIPKCLAVVTTHALDSENPFIELWTDPKSGAVYLYPQANVRFAADETNTGQPGR